jgi:hypothetical protein
MRLIGMNLSPVSGNLIERATDSALLFRKTVGLVSNAVIDNTRSAQ